MTKALWPKVFNGVVHQHQLLYTQVTDLAASMRKLQERAKQARIRGAEPEAQHLDGSAAQVKLQHAAATAAAEEADGKTASARAACTVLAVRVRIAAKETERMTLLRQQMKAERELRAGVDAARIRAKSAACDVADHEDAYARKRESLAQLQAEVQAVEGNARVLQGSGKHMEAAVCLRRIRVLQCQVEVEQQEAVGLKEAALLAQTERDKMLCEVDALVAEVASVASTRGHLQDAVLASSQAAQMAEGVERETAAAKKVRPHTTSLRVNDKTPSYLLMYQQVTCKVS